MLYKIVGYIFDPNGKPIKITTASDVPLLVSNWEEAFKFLKGYRYLITLVEVHK